jgi:hypothetical protein
MSRATQSPPPFFFSDFVEPYGHDIHLAETQRFITARSPTIMQTIPLAVIPCMANYVHKDFSAILKALVTSSNIADTQELRERERTHAQRYKRTKDHINRMPDGKSCQKFDFSSMYSYILVSFFILARYGPHTRLVVRVSGCRSKDPGLDSPALPDFLRSGYGTRSTQPREYNCGATRKK